jgi:hypothetical protein
LAYKSTTVGIGSLLNNMHQFLSPSLLYDVKKYNLHSAP